MNQEVGAVESGRDWATISREIADSPLQHAFLQEPTDTLNEGCPLSPRIHLGGAIIPSFLDDYGLDPYEMRVYIRLARRAGMGGQCWESIPNLARACLMSPTKVKNCLALLSSAQMIKQLIRPGSSNAYELMPSCHWVKSSSLEHLRTQVTSYRQKADQKRRQLYQQQISTKSSHIAPNYESPNYEAPDYETPDYEVADYDVAATRLRGSCPPDYDVAATQLRGSCPPSYDVATKESLLRNPIKDSHEGFPLIPPTPQGEIPRECIQPVNRKNLALEKKCSTSIPDNTGEIQVKTVSVEVVCSAAPSTEQKKNSVAGDDLLDEKLSELLERYNRGEIGKLPEPELKMLAGVVIGDTVKLYRRSGKVLSSAPNDIDRQLMQFIAVRDKQDFIYGTRLIAAMERTPSRWGELVELVAAWQLGDVHAIPTAAKHIALHSRLQQSKQSTFEAIKDL